MENTNQNNNNEILITEKRCTNPECVQVKPLSEFSKDRTKKDGHSTRCKICRKKYASTYILPEESRKK